MSAPDPERPETGPAGEFCLRMMTRRPRASNPAEMALTKRPRRHCSTLMAFVRADSGRVGGFESGFRREESLGLNLTRQVFRLFDCEQQQQVAALQEAAAAADFNQSQAEPKLKPLNYGTNTMKVICIGTLDIK